MTETEAKAPEGETNKAPDAAKAAKSERQRRASTLAASTKKVQASQSQSVSEFVKFTRANLEFQMFALQAQMQLLDTLADMSDDEKLKLLFELIDRDRSGYINARELADGLRKTDEGLAFGESLESAINAVAVFDTDADAKLDLGEFKTFLQSLTSAIGITFHEVSELLVIQILFSESGNNMFEEAVGDLVKDDVDEAVKEVQAFNDVLISERMMALFLLFDLNGDGCVDFKEVAIGLYKILGDMEESAVASVGALLMFDKDDSRTLDYEQFAQLIYNIVAASDGDVTFEEIADVMTVASCGPAVVTDEELEQLMMAGEMYAALKDLEEIENDAMQVMDALQYGRMQRLFDLIDRDHSGLIDFEELTLAMRNFQEAKKMDETVQRAAAIMVNFDSDNDQKLNPAEFAMVLAKLAKDSDIDLHEMIDFFVVTMALKDNDEMEKAYIQSIGSEATAQIKAIQEKLEKGDEGKLVT